jgi:hypothetical protein
LTQDAPILIVDDDNLVRLVLLCHKIVLI